MRLHRPASPITLVVTAAALVFLVAPLLVVILFSFNSNGGLTFPFGGFSTKWYSQVFHSSEFLSALKNSAIVASAVSVVTLVLGTLAALALSRTSSRLRGPIALLFFLPITLPGLFIGIALLVFFTRIKLQLSLATVTIAHCVLVFPYFLLIARAALDRLDPALEESAADLGATPLQVFRLVTLPQIWPVLLAATALSFALSFDEFTTTFFTIGPSSTLPLYIWSSLRRTIDPTINVVSTVLMAVSVSMWIVALLAARRAPALRRRGDAELPLPVAA